MKQIRQSKLLQDTWNVVGAAPIRVKVLGIVIGVIILLGGFVIVQMRDVLYNTLLHELEHQGVALSDNIIDHINVILHSDVSTDSLNTMLAEHQAHYSNDSHNTRVNYMVIEDTGGRFIAGTRSEPLASLGSNQTRYIERENVLEVNRYDATNSHVLRIGIATGPIDQIVNVVTLQLMTTTLVMIAVGFAAAFLLTWILTRPLLDLVSATHAVAKGDFSRRVPRWANDEIGELSTAFNAMTESLQKAETERAEREMLRERYVNGVIDAQENERTRIARELHDSTSQSLTSLLVGLQNLKQTHTENELASRIDQLRSVISITLDEVRTISWRLRPSALDDLGLISALEKYVEDYRERYELTVELVANGMEERLPLEIETAIYRIIQEGLTNIARYAQASAASVIVSRRHNLIRIIIEDNGIGFDPDEVRKSTNSLGLQGIQERAALFNGNLIIESQPGHGTTLYIEIPYTEAREQTHDGAHSNR